MSKRTEERVGEGKRKNGEVARRITRLKSSMNFVVRLMAFPMENTKPRYSLTVHAKSDLAAKRRRNGKRI